jgi:hypothetical protein
MTFGIYLYLLFFGIKESNFINNNNNNKINLKNEHGIIKMIYIGLIVTHR